MSNSRRNPLETIPSSPLASDPTGVASADVPVNTRGGGRIMVNQGLTDDGIFSFINSPYTRPSQL